MNLVHFIPGCVSSPQISPIGPADEKQPKKGKQTLRPKKKARLTGFFQRPM
jgi:hypothetical protein